MNKKRIFGYILLGFVISIFTKYLCWKSYASDESDLQTSFENSKTNNSYPDFISAADKAIECVVHIKSKYLSDELYGYYDPFYGKRF